MKKLGQILRLLLKRWTSKSPDLFIKITNVALWVGLLLLIAAEFTPVGWITTLVTVVGSICLGISGGSKLTTEENEVIEETEKILANKD